MDHGSGSMRVAQLADAGVKLSVSATEDQNQLNVQKGHAWELWPSDD